LQQALCIRNPSHPSYSSWFCLLCIFHLQDMHLVNGEALFYAALLVHEGGYRTIVRLKKRLQGSCLFSVGFSESHICMQGPVTVPSFLGLACKHVCSRKCSFAACFEGQGGRPIGYV
jgi:hypothetical protein